MIWQPVIIWLWFFHFDSELVMKNNENKLQNATTTIQYTQTIKRKMPTTLLVDVIGCKQQKIHFK